ncbi:MAG TPA: hypothetical protein VKI65_13320 [Gemmataceae bacterium]|nr:hypothetical protein [Gemmataceae bacterium]
MNQIQPNPLWIGHMGEGRDFRNLFDLGIKAVVELAMEEQPLQPPRELISCRFPLLDGAGNRAELLFLAVSTVASLLKMRIPTLLCCSAGGSRSPAVAAAALAMIHHEPPEECLERVVEQHASDVSPGFWDEVTRLLPSVR